MEDILEIIFTIVVGFFWLFGGSLFKKRDQEDSKPQTPPRRNRRKKDDPTLRDSEVRQREIREAIRRKIAERRQQSEPEPMVAYEPRPNYQEEQRKSFEPQEKASEPLVFTEPQERQVEASFSRKASGDAYGQVIQKRLQEIEATKRRAEALRSKVKKLASDEKDSGSSRSSGQEPTLSLGSVKSALRNPKNVRAAFIYREILGKPVGLQNSTEIGMGV